MLKTIASRIPATLREPLLSRWRQHLGNPEINILKFISDPTRLALDIGANGGSYTGELNRLSAGCEAFEPVPELAKLVADNHPTVQVHACALSDRSGIVTLRIPIFNGGENPQNATVELDDLTVRGASRDIDVPRKRLDDFALSPVGLIKMDIEGHEESVLLGATELIERDKPAVLIEGDEPRHKPGCVTAISQYFLARGYQGWFLLGRHIVPLSQFDPSLHQNPENLDANMNVIFNRDYAWLFIFAADQPRIRKLRSMAQKRTRL